MSSKRSKGSTPPARGRDAGRSSQPAAPSRRIPPVWIVAGIAAVMVIVVVAGWVVLSGQGGATKADTNGYTGTAVQADGGSWTNITPDTLASMLETKDFTLLNVKTPYIGEIAGTDLYIPYDQIAARAAELPADRKARIVVYCRTGHESAIAAQTLLTLGYSNIANLDGGMTAWTGSGRSLVQLPRS
jgi:rhodanese-related sulfurtransferase